MEGTLLDQLTAAHHRLAQHAERLDAQRVDVRFLLVDATKMTVLGEGTINLTPLVVGTMTERPVQQLQLVDRRHVTIGHIVTSVKAADAAAGEAAA